MQTILVRSGLIVHHPPQAAAALSRSALPPPPTGTARLTDHMRLVAGARWHHISNTAKRGFDRNPGFDGAMFYAGVIMPF